MTEKEMEELIKAFPSEFIEEDLELLSNQQTITSGRIDLVFKTRFDELLVVEIKKGPLNRKHLGQVLDYYAHMKEMFPDKSIQPMLIGTEISKEFKITLKHSNVDYREIPLKKFFEISKSKNIKTSEEVENRKEDEEDKRTLNTNG